LIRGRGQLRHCVTADSIHQVEPNRPVAVAGLVTGRQRPGSAAGVTFVTLEDETGNLNVIVWQATARRQRRPCSMPGCCTSKAPWNSRTASPTSLPGA